MGKRLFRGMLAGLAGALVMHELRVVWEAVYRDGPDGIFGFDEEADLASVERVVGGGLGKVDALRLALVFHYGIGAAAGAVYGCLPKRPSGVVFGLGLWLTGGEAAIALSGVSDPLKKSVRSHASALLVHAAYGAVVGALTGEL